MAIIDRNGNKTYIGAVIGERSHMWMDGMEDVFAIVYDSDSNSIKEIQTGYYAITGQNQMEMSMDVDLDTDNARAVVRFLKNEANFSFASSVAAEKKAIKKGRKVEVIKGRKVKKGTILEVFWVGERPTYMSRQYSWINETEKVAGCYDKDGNKVWIKVEYLKNITEIKSPSAKERKKYIKHYVESYFPKYYGIYGLTKIAMGS